MKNFIQIILILLGQIIFSQNVENISKINLTYSKGSNSWGKNGVYSRVEIFELTKTEKGDFKISKHLKIDEKTNGKIFSKDSTILKTSKYKFVSKNEIQNLLTSLNINKENFTEEYLKQNFTKPTKSEIIEIAKKSDHYLKKDIENIYSQIQAYKYLEEFVKIEKSNINNTLLTVDAWNSLRIITSFKEENKIYTLDFFKNCGQPISINYAQINKSDHKVEIKQNKSYQIVNLDVNLILQKILPNDTNLWNSLNLNNIRNEYIIWFLENKLI
ncbi:hypothetical protein [Flavobacterium aestuarii]|uniref:hypothetical protein n=1 Tax=Flavobacterium aestuarii TaxID=3149227 RepID=UPI0032B54F65